MEYETTSAEETIILGETFGKTLPDNAIVCFFGDLAAGKTTFIKGVVAALTEYSQDEVISPTFVYLNIYSGSRTVYHFDLYRLNRPEDFLGMGFDEFLYAGGISCIEWSERIDALLPRNVIRVEMRHVGGDKRRITVTHE